MPDVSPAKCGRVGRQLHVVEYCMSDVILCCTTESIPTQLSKVLFKRTCIPLVAAVEYCVDQLMLFDPNAKLQVFYFFGLCNNSRDLLAVQVI